MKGDGKNLAPSSKERRKEREIGPTGEGPGKGDTWELLLVKVLEKESVGFVPARKEHGRRGRERKDRPSSLSSLTQTEGSGRSP